MKTKIKNALIPLSIASIGIVVIFFTFPSLLIVQNWDDLGIPVAYFQASVVAGLLFTLVLWTLFILLPQKMGMWIAILIATYGLVLYGFDLAFPLTVGPIETGEEKVVQALFPALLQFAVYLCLFFILLKLPLKLLKTVLISFSAVLLISSLLPFLPFHRKSEFDPNTAGKDSKPATVKNEYANAKKNSGTNIYHFIFDAYEGPWLEWSMRELKITDEEFENFIHYKGTKTNYPDTASSFTSFMSGTHYNPQISFRKWGENADADSLVTDLNRLDYTTTIYAPMPRNGFKNAQHIIIGKSIPAALVCDYWLLRIVPVILRTHVLKKGSGPFSRSKQLNKSHAIGDLRAFNSYNQLAQFLKDEPTRPMTGQYVMVYFQLPHGPYQMNRHGKFVGRSSYDEQLHLATNMTKQLIEQLKKMGRYDRSLIIIHSDHGISRDGPEIRNNKLRNFVKMDEKTSITFEKIDVRNTSGRRLETKFSPLLMIKPDVNCVRKKGGPLEVVAYPTQLLDLRKFIKGSAENPLNGCEYPKTDAIDIIHGLVTQEIDGKRLSVGRELLKGRINHYRYTEKEGLTVLPDETFTF